MLRSEHIAWYCLASPRTGRRNSPVGVYCEQIFGHRDCETFIPHNVEAIRQHLKIQHDISDAELAEVVLCPFEYRGEPCMGKYAMERHVAAEHDKLDMGVPEGCSICPFEGCTYFAFPNAEELQKYLDWWHEGKGPVG